MIPSQMPCSPTRPFSLCDPNSSIFILFCPFVYFFSFLFFYIPHSIPPLLSPSLARLATSLQVRPVRCGLLTAASALSHFLTRSVARAAETPPNPSPLRPPPPPPPLLRKQRRPPARQARHPTYQIHLCAIPQSLAPPPKCLHPYRSPISNNREPTTCLTPRLTPPCHWTLPGRRPAFCAPPAPQVRLRFIGGDKQLAWSAEWVFIPWCTSAQGFTI